MDLALSAELAICESIFAICRRIGDAYWLERDTSGGDVEVQRQWAGLADMTVDYSPIISPVDEIEGLDVNCGWGTWGFAATPASGLDTAQMVASGRVPENIQPFGLSRFAENRLVGEKAAASVSS